MSVLVVSTATMTPQRSQLMFPLYPPLSVLEKRIPDLLILLFLLSWSLETGDDTGVFAVFWSCVSTVSPLRPPNDTPDNQVSGQWWESAVHEHRKGFDLIVFASFSVAILYNFLYPEASLCVFVLKGSIPPPLSKHVRNLVVLISVVTDQCIAQRRALCCATRSLNEIRLDARRFD